MTTVTLQAGNSDNKLTQQEWSAFVAELTRLIEIAHNTQLHFFGSPPGYSPWQNAAWVFVTEHTQDLAAEVVRIRFKYNQCSVAWTEGATKFI